MTQKNIPFWLKVGLVISIFYLILLIGFFELKIWSFGAIMFFILKPVTYMLDSLNVTCENFKYSCNTTILFLLGLIYFFAIGSFVGLFIHKIQKKFYN